MDFLSFDILAAVCYSALILLSALSSNPLVRYIIPLLTVGLSASFGISLLFIAQAMAYIGITFLLQNGKARPDWFKYLVWVVWGILTIGLLTHTLPGYSGLQLTFQEPVKANSMAVSVFLNTDKVLIAWSLIMWIPIWKRNSSVNTTLPLWQPFMVAVAGIPLILFLATRFGLIQWQPEANDLVLIIVISNLLNTCFTEELIFRGAIQSWLSSKLGVIPGLLIASTLFGLAHFAGGFIYICLAILAGLLYGLVYVLSGRLFWSVVCHWSLNSAHVLLLTWPVVKPG